MNIDEILDVIDELLDRSWSLPLSGGRCVVDADKVRDLIDDIRSQFPMELTEARKMMARRAEMEAEAKRKADAIVRSAEERAKQMLAADTIALQARQRANDMMRQAEERSRELKRSANEYCEDALRRTEEAVAEAYNEIKQSRSRFRAAASASAGGAAAPQVQGRMMYDAAADED